MKELKILAVVVFFTLLTYFGVEPYAHTQMHSHVSAVDYNYDGKQDVEMIEEQITTTKLDLEKAASKADNQAVASIKNDISKLELKKSKTTKFWKKVSNIASLDGNVENGKIAYSSCTGCHNGAGIVMGGVVPPKLENSAKIYSKNYLLALMSDPVYAMNVDHKYTNAHASHPMGSVAFMVNDQQIADIYAYLNSIKPEEMSNKEVTSSACLRCHTVKYDDTNNIKDQTALDKYMGSTPPDLSMMIRSKKADYLENFINNPQKKLPGTAMPRVGLDENATKQVIAYLENVGDSKKVEREESMIKTIIYMIIFSLIAYLWKRSMWKGLH